MKHKGEEKDYGERKGGRRQKGLWVNEEKMMEEQTKV